MKRVLFLLVVFLNLAFVRLSINGEASDTESIEFDDDDIISESDYQADYQDPIAPLDILDDHFQPLESVIRLGNSPVGIILERSPISVGHQNSPAEISSENTAVLPVNRMHSLMFFDGESKGDEEETDFSIPIAQSSISNIKPSFSSIPNPDRIVNSNTDISGRKGLQNHANICYMNSIISTLFNIKNFRNSLYAAEHKTTSSVLLAEVFAKMQLSSKTSISTKSCLMHAIRKELDWGFGQFQCVLEFAELLFDRLPVQNVFKLHNRYSNMMTATGETLKAKMVEDNIYIMPTGFASIADAIALKFVDREAEDYKIELADQHEYTGLVPAFSEPFVKVPIYNETTIMNRPELIVLGIRRVIFFPKITFDRTKVEANFRFELPGIDGSTTPVKYLLHGFSFHVPGHYMSYVRDFSRGNPEGDWYLYNDAIVSAVRTASDYAKLREAADTSACLLFYSREDSVDFGHGAEVPIAPEISRLAKLFLSLEELQESKAEYEAEAHRKRNEYKRSPAYNPSSHDSPQSSIASAEAVYGSRTVRTDDEVKRSPLLPTDTGVRFTRDFPLDQNYGSDEIDLS
jgi:hypothetical protein